VPNGINQVRQRVAHTEVYATNLMWNYVPTESIQVRAAVTHTEVYATNSTQNYVPQRNQSRCGRGGAH